MRQKKTTVTLEDLLRVKRAERPAPEFWAEFERELRAKQLAAIIGPRPWWASFIRLGARASHYQLPVGAAAILALSFVTIREYRTLDSAALAQTEVAAVTHATARIHLHATPMAAGLATPAPTEEQIESAVVQVDSETVAAIASVGRIAHAVPLLDMATPVSEPTPSERAIAANLAAAQAADPGIVDEVFGSIGRNVEVRERISDPLARMSVPGEYRRSRLLATALPVMAGSTDVLVGSSDRVARHLTEQRLYDSISRIGVKGDRVAIKF